MVYLENKTELQELWIPRNDGQGVPYNPTKELEGVDVTISQDITVVHPSSGYYGMSAVTIDATEYGQQNYDSGFDDGYIDGYASGSTEGYESGYTSGYTSGSTDGYNSGYTSGETHQKSLLVSTAITENGSYQRENGYSAITVNVPTGQTYNIEENHPFTATSNGDYTINPSDIWSITYDRTYARRYDFTINGTIPQTKIGKIAYIVRYDDEDTGEEPSVVIIIGSGNTLTINKNNWDEDDYGDVDFMLWQGKYRLEFDNDNLHTSDFSIIPYSNREKYDAMSAVSLNVNVPQTGHTDQELQDAYDSGYTSGSTDGFSSGYTSGETHQKSLLVSTAITQNGTYTRENGYSAITVNVPQTGSTNSIISVTGNTWYVLDHYFGTGEQIEITNATFDYSVANVARHQQLIAGGDGEWVRIGGAGDVFYTSYYGDNKITSHTILDDDHILLKNGEFYVNDMETPVSIFSLSPLDIFKDTRMVVFANTASGGDSVCGQTASVGVITIYDENDTVVDKYIPELHNGVVCLHNVISGNYITPSGTGTPTITNTDYSEGYIDGRQDVINTFTAITATTNGVYGSSAQPLSSITVNVSQTGGSGVKYVEYIETDGSNIVYDTGIKITSNNVKIYLDYMRHSGSTEDYTGLVSQMYNDMLFSYLFFVPGNWNRDIIMPRFGGDNYEVPSLLDTYYETVVSNTGATINGVDYPHTFSGFQETDEHMYLNAQHHYGSFRRFAIARYYRFAVESGGTLLVDMRPCLDENDVPCFYDEVSETYIYHTGSGTPIAGPVIQSPDYESGYTDGYASGYTSGVTDGENNIVSTFTAMTATTNGVYGSSAHPLSSITVNVPQSGGSVTYVDWISNDPLSNVPLFSNLTQYIDLGVTPDYTTKIRVKGYYQNRPNGLNVVGNNPSQWQYATVVNKADYVYSLFWYAGSDGKLYLDFDDDSRLIDNTFGSHISGDFLDYTVENNSVYDNVTGQYLVSGSPVSEFYSTWNIVLDVQTWRPQSVEIWKGNIKVFDGKAAVDGEKVGLFDSISQTMVYNSALTMTYGNVLPSQDYQSGYTDGYSSGYTSGTTDGFSIGYAAGSDAEKDLLSAITFTANTAMTLNSGGYSAITVNVPQSGSPSVLGSGSFSANGTYSASTDNIDGYSVVTVNVPQSFSGDVNIGYVERTLTEINVQSGCTKIGRYAFSSFDNLTAVTIPNTVISTDAFAFAYNPSLLSVTLPNSLTNLGAYIFCRCISLSSITIPNSVTDIEFGAFQECKSLSSVTIPNSVTVIQSATFFSCDSLSSVTIPNTITRIEGNAFHKCTSLTSVTIPSLVQWIGIYAFDKCTSLTDIYTQATTAPGIHSDAFRDISSTGTVHYPAGSDYSSWQSNQYLSGWTFVGDL